MKLHVHLQKYSEFCQRIMEAYPDIKASELIKLTKEPRMFVDSNGVIRMFTQEDRKALEIKVHAELKARRL